MSRIPITSTTRALVQEVLTRIQETEGEIKLSYKPASVAKILDISRAHAYKLIEKGHLPSVNFPTVDGEGPRCVTLGQLIDYVTGRELEERKRA